MKQPYVIKTYKQYEPKHIVIHGSEAEAKRCLART